MVTDGGVWRIRSFVLPGGVIVLAAVAAWFSGLPDLLISGLAPWYALVPAGVGLLLGLRFGQGRAVCALTAIAAAVWVLASPVVAGAGFGAAGIAATGAAGILLPFDIALFSLLKERSLFTRGGLLWLGFVLVQPFAAGGAYALFPGRFEAAIGHRFTSAALIERLAVPQPSLAVFLVAFVACGLGVALRHGPLENGFFWALVAVFLAVGASRPADSVFYLSTAGLVLAASVVEAAYGMAFHDRLTGLPSRRSLEDELAKLRGRFTLAMVDVDHFKRFNDRYGHDVGDQVLRMVSSKLARAGGGGRAYRYGGEEFTVIFPGRSTDEALPHLEDLRKGIAGSNFTVRGPDRPRRKPKGTGKRGKKETARGGVSVTVSIGAAWAEAGGAEPSLVIKAADKALLRAKKTGRNRVETWKG